MLRACVDLSACGVCVCVKRACWVLKWLRCSSLFGGHAASSKHRALLKQTGQDRRARLMMGSMRLTHTCIDTRTPAKTGGICPRKRSGGDRRVICTRGWKAGKVPVSDDTFYPSLFAPGCQTEEILCLRFKYYQYDYLFLSCILKAFCALSVLYFDSVECSFYSCLSVCSCAGVHACLSTLIPLCSGVLDRSELIRPLWSICLYLGG